MLARDASRPLAPSAHDADAPCKKAPPRCMPSQLMAHGAQRFLIWGDSPDDIRRHGFSRCLSAQPRPGRAGPPPARRGAPSRRSRAPGRAGPPPGTHTPPPGTYTPPPGTYEVHDLMFFSHTLYLRVLQGDSAYGPHGVYVPGEEVYVPGGARREGLARRTARRTATPRRARRRGVAGKDGRGWATRYPPSWTSGCSSSGARSRGWACRRGGSCRSRRAGRT